MFKVNVDYPTVDELIAILDRTTGAETPEASKVADGKQVISLGQLALNTPIATHVTNYVARLIVATHPEDASAPEIVKKYVRYGASPRGAQGLILGAKINALLDGELQVGFKDIEAVALSALRHRILLNFEGLAEGVSPDAIINEVIKALPKTK